ncbi:response regulator [Duganella sp. FT94W]|uniref:histidine kinase n=1 Tax=Duganella lactea TaxID=2692173 RepID=A0ABW9V310_9BURK|nr:hybrid sensor histidine kinase/response regulator [Duganella lactea]MYM33316.1 response regulator [Duganella lactea]
MNRDLSSLSRAALEELLALGRLQRHALFEAIDDGFCIIQFIDGPHGPLSDYLHIEANSGYQRHTGIGDIVGKRLREIEPDNAQTWLDLYGKVLRTGETLRFEQEFQAVGRHIEVSATRLGPVEMGQVSVLFRDITARKRTEAALQENVQRLQLAMAAGAIIGTWVWDVPSDRFSIDEGFAAAFGFESARVQTGLTLPEVIERVHPDDRAGLMAAITAALSRGGAYAHQYRTRRRDGNYCWLEANGRVELTADGQPGSFPGVLIDIEGKRALEAERDRALAALRALNDTLEQRVEQRTAALLKAEDALRQAQKMEAVGQLTGGLAHDFNNILAGIGGSLELMKIRMAQGRMGDLERHVSGAQSAVRRAAALTQRLLAFSRRQTLDPKPSNLNRIVGGMQELICRSVGPSIAVETVATGSLWNTFVDIGQIENALLNLCLNARDAMSDGGKLTIATANRTLDQQAAASHGVAAGDYVALSVSDTGAGMTPEVLARAFEPFFTTKPAGQGTGLGLSMVYGFAGQSGGTVRIDSAPGRGATVSLLLPRHAGAAESDDTAPATPSAAPALWRKKILVVDDEPLVRLVAVEVLADLGYDVVEAEDGAGALVVLGAHPDIDLLVTDVGLPNGMNGRQLADAVRARCPDMPVLFVTGYAEHAVLNHGHLAPGTQVLTKPFTADGLDRRVRQLLGQLPGQDRAAP